jgi:glutamate-1-semialdehyde 2,1-aminomutase
MGNLRELFEKAREYYVGGASAGQRYNKVLEQPLYIDHAGGCLVYDIEGREYIDYHTGAGAALFGHNHPRIKNAIEKAVSKGFFMNFDTEHHLELGQLLRGFFPSAEKIRLTNTGSEATQAAIRVARSFTGKDKIVKFDGHFHGMHENIWFNHDAIAPVDSSGEVETVPDSQGFPKNAKENVVTVLFNDIDALCSVVKKYRGQIAAIIIEPVSFNCGCLEARKEYLRQVRELCSAEGIVLIFDEVICGLRMRPGSAQAYFNVIPDMTTMAKAIAGGLSIAAFGGRTEIMNSLAPVGKTIVSGTYTGNLIAVMGACECLKMARETGFYDQIDKIGKKLYSGIDDLFNKHALPGHVRGLGARFAFYFGVEDKAADFDFRAVAQKHDFSLYKRFVTQCLPHGLWFHDTAGSVSPAHYGFTTAHTEAIIDTTLERIDTIFGLIK